MDIYRICRTCLNESYTNLVSIHSAVNQNNDDIKPSERFENNTKIANILDDLTENKYNSDIYPYPNKICGLCLNNLKNAFDFKQRCVNAFEKLMKLSDFNTAYTDEYDGTKAFMQVDVDVLMDENVAISEENDTFFDGNDTHVDGNESNEIQEPKKKKYKTTKNSANVTMKKEANLSEASDEKKRYPCTECGRSFARTTHLKRHMTIHTDERAYACSQCDKRFRRGDHLHKHFESQHSKIKPHKCEQCQKAFSRVEHLRNHIFSRHTRNPSGFECIECKFECETVKELKRHQKSHYKHEIACKICREPFLTKSELSEHSKKHYDERPFLCTECGMRFIRNDYLVVHMRRHTGEKPYKCKFCSRAFPRNTDLTIHERYHTNDKRHVCNECGKGFARAYNLMVHRRTHTGEKPYQCEYCARCFAQRNDLKSHVRRHTGERYGCEFCGASFIQTYLLTNHKKDVHGIDTKSPSTRLTKFEPFNQNIVNELPMQFTQQNETVCNDHVKSES